MSDIEGLDRAAGRLESELERGLQDLRAARQLLQGVGVGQKLEKGLKDRLRLAADGVGAAAHIFGQQLDDSGDEVPTTEEVLQEE